MMTEYEKAEAGYFYQAHADAEIDERRKKSQELNYKYNILRPCQQKERVLFLNKNMGKVGSECVIEQPFYCDFWERVFLGNHFFSNYNFVILAGNRIKIGDYVWIGPDCGLYAAGHPFNWELRAKGIEYAWPITIGNHVWIGGGTKILGGVTIGDYAVIAAGSVVNKDIPAHVLAGGNPCRVIRKISLKDDEKYRKGYIDWRSCSENLFEKKIF